MSDLAEQLAQVTAERDALLLELDQVAPRFRLLADVTFEIFTVSEANLSEHHMARAKRTARQKDATLAALAARFGGTAGPQLLAQHGRLLVSLVRLGAQALDDDNLAGSLKHVRDATARWLGCDDNPGAPVRWYPTQEPHKRHKLRPAVRVEFHVLAPRRKATS
jgi:hypothetical protein